MLAHGSMGFEILFQNEEILAVDKPHGWLTTPARLADDPRPCLGRELQRQVGRQIYPVHRLDFEVSGITLWALSAIAHREAQEWFEHARVRKLYQALSQAATNGASREWSEWKSNLVRGKKRAFAAPHGKPSLTLARVVAEQPPDHLLWELVAVTGRPHQLRYEMSHHGFPIVGDVLYGGEMSPREGWLALRAVEIDFSKVEKRFGLPAVVRVSDLRSFR